MAITINGSGTITGISQGGLPDDVITADDIKDSDYQAPLTAGTDYQAPLVAGTDYLEPDGDGSSLTGIDTSPPTTYGAIGTYTSGTNGSSSISGGTTTAGSNIRVGNNYNSSSVRVPFDYRYDNDYSGNWYNPGLSGTWRCMTYGQVTGYGGFARVVTLWCRIS